MDNKYCNKPGCNNIAISLSDYCGEHTNSRLVRKQLRNHKDREFKELNLHALILKDLDFKDKLFSQAKLDDCEFSFTRFTDCEFDLPHFIHLNFDVCRFENCSFIRFEADDVTWMNCTFVNCTFKEGQFTQCSFDASNFNDCKFETTEFNGHLFTDIEKFDFCHVELCLFLQVSFTRINMFATTIDNSDLNKSSLYDSSFIHCTFKDSSNDFKQTGPPMLCHFNETVFTNFYLPRSAKRWNNFKLSPAGFYRKIVRMVLGMTEDAEDSLSELTLALTHLDKLNYRPPLSFNNDINELFSRLIKRNARKASYERVGDIINEYGKVPERYRTKSSFLLPPPGQEKPVIIRHHAKLTLQVKLDEWQLQSVSRFFNQLAALERRIPGQNTQILSQLDHGSLISVFWADIKQLLYTGRLLDVEKLEISIAKDEADLHKTQLEIERQKIELDSLNEDKALDRIAKQQNIEALRLSNLEKKLDLLERLEKRNGVDAHAFANTAEGKPAAEIAEAIRQEFPIISLRIDENTSEE